MSEQEKQDTYSPEQNENINAPKKKKKKHHFRRFLIIAAAIVFIWWFNNYTLTTPEYTVYSDKISGSFRIAVLSDLHATEHGISNEKIVNKINDAAPDLVFMLGDMYSRDSDESEIAIPIELVSMLTSEGYSVYFIPGEHDTAQSYLEGMEKAGAHVMDYRGEIIDVNGNSVQILGIDNVYFSPTFDLNNAFTLADGCYTILMAHIPNYEAYSAFGADLTICGDTHGGIIQLPFDKGPAYYSETGEWFPEISGQRDDIYDKGMFPYEGGAMFITSGIGAYPVPARFNNRPEIAIIDIEPES